MNITFSSEEMQFILKNPDIHEKLINIVVSIETSSKPEEKDKPKPEAKKPEAKKPEAKKPEGTVNTDEIREMAMACIKNGGAPQVKAIAEKYGSKRITEISDGMIDLAYKDLKALKEELESV